MFSKILWQIGLLLVVITAGGGCMSVPERAMDIGPLYSVDRDLHGTTRVRMLGPLLERREDGTNRVFTAIRPLKSTIAEPEQERAVTDVLWPLGMFKTRKGELDWRLFPAFGHDFGLGKEGSRHRWSVFPVLFGGRSRDGDNYVAMFPLGGTLHEFFGYNRIVFMLFPLFAYSERDTSQTHSVLWPVYSRTVGEGVYRFRVWPFYGVSVRDDRWIKRFVMWPIWTSVRYQYPNESGGGFVLFPLYGQVDVENRHSRMLLPPLFKVEWTDDGHRAVNAPWPFVQYSRGDIDKFYLWPLYGRKVIGGHDHQWFALWPLVSARHSERPRQTLRRFRALPFIFYEAAYVPATHANASATGTSASGAGEVPIEVESPSPKAISRYVKLWPLFSYRREADHSRFRLLALWPLKHTPAVERGWAPLWTLFERERAGEVKDTELLWGLYRHRRSASGRRLSIFPLLQTRMDTEHDKRDWSFLYGLAGYRREGLQKQFKLLYFLEWGATVDDLDAEHTQREVVEP